MRFPHDIPGWLTEEEGHALYELARGKVVLEIGSYCGRSTVCIAQAAERVHAVDPFDGRGTPDPTSTLEIFKLTLSDFDVSGKVTTHIGTSAEAILPEGFDMAFIDGAHDFRSVMTDVAIARKVLKPGGLLVFHDYRTFPGEYDSRWDEGVTNAVTALLNSGMKLLSRHGSIAVLDTQTVSETPERPLVALAMCRRGRQIADDGAAEGFYRFPARKAQIGALLKPQSTVLPHSFNEAWTQALNLRDAGVPLTHYAQIHDDISPPPWWLDTLIEEMVTHNADVVAAVVPIKTQHGTTSTAVYTGDLWLPRRLTMAEVMELPETFGQEHVEGPLLLNTGLWVADITKPWADEVCFDFQTRIRRTSTGERVAEFVPEDWLNSHRLNELGCRLFATRKVRVEHLGESDYPNDKVWGWKTDEVYRQRNAKKEEHVCASNS